jgi:hypothetical protein
LINRHTALQPANGNAVGVAVPVLILVYPRKQAWLIYPEHGLHWRRSSRDIPHSNTTFLQMQAYISTLQALCCDVVGIAHAVLTYLRLDFTLRSPISSESCMHGPYIPVIPAEFEVIEKIWIRSQ